MSQSMTGRNIVYTVKVGDLSTLGADIVDSSGVVKDLSDTTLYSTAKWKVWKPDGTLIINGSATYLNRAGGVVAYTLQASDTVLANAGVWDGEVEMYNISGAMTEQSQTFTFIIQDSY